MGKNKRERKDGEEKSPQSATTVCVSGLPYSITNAQVPSLILPIIGGWLVVVETYVLLSSVVCFLQIASA